MNFRTVTRACGHREDADTYSHQGQRASGNRPCATCEAEAVPAARERNLQRGFHPFEGLDAAMGEIARDQLLAAVEEYVQSLEGTDRYWNAEHARRDLRRGIPKRRPGWWIDRARHWPETLLREA